ncbi:GNAT family N-acetyltransferase [Streptomyces hainanensis]|uniref:GNAT family N-acetyltransferase n=1 Tax=Streptomyces hainanensis TaxID=402648 RepID=A0A4R4TFB5_9ACTN|nr:GNAT family N-acetyltransferase [Streptomyces hainanensis]TDC73872.1 GNAT family N-acetyltransferase [Streptomyces hainanensis]
MRSDGWHLTEDIERFLGRAGDFLRSRPALHTMPLTVTEKLRTGGNTEGAVFGHFERSGEVLATCFQRPPGRVLSMTPLAPEHVDALAGRLADLGRELPGVSTEYDTATAFADAWRRRTGAEPTLSHRLRLYRLATLTPPDPLPPGRGRVAGEAEHERVVRWCREFCAAVGEAFPDDPEAWAGTRFAGRTFMFWETPDGIPVSMAAATPMVAGQIRVDPVYTPAPLRGRGYAAAVSVAVSRAALAAGAREVVLFADAANPTSNALYQRIGFRRLADFAVYGFSAGRGLPGQDGRRPA